jgi:5-methylcytosine-specific restriction endonuclease McrA
MSNEWSDTEIDACVRTYLWMRKAIAEGFKPTKKRIREALISGPVHGRSHGSIEFRFQNISAVLDTRSEPWIDGYKPRKNVGAETAKRISEFLDTYHRHRHSRRLNWLINSLPSEVVRVAASKLASGIDFQYPDSTDYDLDIDGVKLPPKKVIGYAGLLHYGAPLFSENFSGGEKTPCFNKLGSSGFNVAEKLDPLKTDPESKDFRKAVSQIKAKGSGPPPRGNARPKKHSQSSVCYERDANVVAYAETRADGICELCSLPAPFNRPDGTPFLEVHHIIPLAEGGPDTVENAAALCPNCHRACHHGEDADQHRKTLLLSISVKHETG